MPQNEAKGEEEQPRRPARRVNADALARLVRKNERVPFVGVRGPTSDRRRAPPTWRRVEPGLYVSSDEEWEVRRVAGAGLRGWVARRAGTELRHPFRSFERARNWIANHYAWRR